MEEKSPNEELINKLIKKRKLENDAFAKLLNAMKVKNGNQPDSGQSADTQKNNPRK